MLEKELEAKVVAYAKKKGCICWKFSSPSNRGVPDRIIVSPDGVVMFLELKAKGGKLSKLQEKINLDLQQRGAKAFISDSYPECINLINDLCNGKI